MVITEELSLFILRSVRIIEVTELIYETYDFEFQLCHYCVSLGKN
jgi:hypothetical protein